MQDNIDLIFYQILHWIIGNLKSNLEEKEDDKLLNKPCPPNTPDKQEIHEHFYWMLMIEWLMQY